MIAISSPRKLVLLNTTKYKNINKIKVGTPSIPATNMSHNLLPISLFVSLYLHISNARMLPIIADISAI